MTCDRRLFQLIRQVNWSVGSEADRAGKGHVGKVCGLNCDNSSGCLISKSCLLIVNKHREYLGDLEESLNHGFWGDFSVLKPNFEQALVSGYFLGY